MWCVLHTAVGLAANHFCQTGAAQPATLKIPRAFAPSWRRASSEVVAEMPGASCPRMLPLATLLWSASAAAARPRLSLGHGPMPIPAVTLCRRRSGGAQMRGGGKRKGLVPVKGKPDAGIAPVEATNFIRNIIKQDLSSGKHASIVTRFPPEPNGYLHIGHAKAICVNFGLGQEFGGATYMRLDDTNPAKEEQEYVDSILADVKWLGSAAWSNYPCSPCGHLPLRRPNRLVRAALTAQEASPRPTRLGAGEEGPRRQLWCL